MTDLIANLPHCEKLLEFHEKVRSSESRSNYLIRHIWAMKLTTPILSSVSVANTFNVPLM